MLMLKSDRKQLRQDKTGHHTSQSECVCKGRTNFDAVRTIDDIFEYTKREKINGV